MKRLESIYSSKGSIGKLNKLDESIVRAGSLMKKGLQMAEKSSSV